MQQMKTFSFTFAELGANQTMPVEWTEAALLSICSEVLSRDLGQIDQPILQLHSGLASSYLHSLVDSYGRPPIFGI